jgi:hypothetical protein
MKFPFDADALRLQGPIEEPPEPPMPVENRPGFFQREIKVKTLISGFAYTLAGAILTLTAISEFHGYWHYSGARSLVASARSKPSAASLGPSLAAPPAVFSDDPATPDAADNPDTTTLPVRSPFEGTANRDQAEPGESRKVAEVKVDLRPDPKPTPRNDAPPFREALPAVEQHPSPVVPLPAPASVPLTVSLAPPPEPEPVVPAPPARTPVSIDVSVEPREEGSLKRAARGMGRVPLLGRLPGLRHERDEPVFAAQPSENLSPRIPADVSRKLTEQVEVDIDASIDEDGAVKNAEIVRGDDPQLSVIAEDAVRAAHWKPARSGDRSVPMRVVVHYRFNPGREP